MKIFRLKEFHTPAHDLPREKVGKYRISSSNYSKGIYDFYGMAGYKFWYQDHRMPITLLQERGKDQRWHQWMVDDPPHWFAMQRYAESCFGEVLVAGLGLGLVATALAANPAVTKVTIVERSQEVRDLVWPTVQQRPGAEKLRLHWADFYDVWHAIPYDSAVVDLWVANGWPEKRRLLYGEVLPLWARMLARNPEAPLFFHGFISCMAIDLLEEVELTKYIPEAIRVEVSHGRTVIAEVPGTGGVRDDSLHFGGSGGSEPARS
ncbi:MAG: hypothetical protein Q8R28_15100 [Dehalococcoidia bacterium]|nr:hypothetical protein [Dehalococcoidia bacterium]